MIRDPIEGVCRHHDVRAVVCEVILALRPFAFGEARMIPNREASVLSKDLADILHGFPGGAVDDSGHIREFFHVFEQESIFVLRVFDLKKEICPVESGCQDKRGCKAEHADDVVLYLGRRRRRESRDDGTP